MNFLSSLPPDPTSYSPLAREPGGVLPGTREKEKGMSARLAHGEEKETWYQINSPSIKEKKLAQFPRERFISMLLKGILPVADVMEMTRPQKTLGLDEEGSIVATTVGEDRLLMSKVLPLELIEKSFMLDEIRVQNFLFLLLFNDSDRDLSIGGRGVDAKNISYLRDRTEWDVLRICHFDFGAGSTLHSQYDSDTAESRVDFYMERYSKNIIKTQREREYLLSLLSDIEAQTAGDEGREFLSAICERAQLEPPIVYDDFRNYLTLCIAKVGDLSLRA